MFLYWEERFNREGEIYDVGVRGENYGNDVFEFVK